ncbi:MAG: hypothetical protein H6728_00430 [Myxococcales bacterium]|nr:hypothetical protein [Myxococcales bacterium]
MGKEQTSPQIQTQLPLHQAGTVIEGYLYKHYGESLAEEAVHLWDIYQNQFHPQFRKATTHAAAFLYAFLRLRLNNPPSQQQIANHLHAPVGSLGLLGKRYREDLRKLHIESACQPHEAEELPQLLSPCTAALRDPGPHWNALHLLASEQNEAFLHTLRQQHPLSLYLKSPRTPAPNLTLNAEQYNLLLRLPFSEESWTVGTLQLPAFTKSTRGIDLLALWFDAETEKLLHIDPFRLEDAGHLLCASFVDTATAPKDGYPRLPKRVFVSQKHWLEPFRSFLAPLNIEVLFDQTDDFSQAAKAFLLPTTHLSLLQRPHLAAHSRLQADALAGFQKEATALYEILQKKPRPPYQPLGFYVGRKPEQAEVLYIHQDLQGYQVLLFQRFEDWRLFATRCFHPKSLLSLDFPPLRVLAMYFPLYGTLPYSTRKLATSHNSPKRLPLVCEWLVDQQIAHHATQRQYEKMHAACKVLQHALQVHEELLWSKHPPQRDLALSFNETQTAYLQIPHPRYFAL